MNRLLFLILSGIFAIQLHCQETGLGKPHESKYKNIPEGKHSGTISGVLSLKKQNDVEIILDFQASKAELLIEHDPEEMYDVSTKRFVGYTTSGKTRIEYRFYAGANEFKVELNNTVYVAGIIDGAADLVILGLTYKYFQEEGMEYLTLNFISDINLYSTKDRSAKLIIEKGSSLVFAIRD